MASSLPWIERIEELIADGPVEVNWLIAEVSGLVPPGRAWRAREWHRKYAARKKGLVATNEAEVTDEAIWTGQRSVIRESIGKLVWAKRARYLMQDGVKYLERTQPPRLDPEELSRRHRERWENLDEKTRTEWIDRMHQPRTKASRSEATRRGWETRRQKKSQST
jgi:hypothetical protein